MGSQRRWWLFALALVVGALVLVALVWRGERSPRNNFRPEGTAESPTAAKGVTSLAAEEAVLPAEHVAEHVAEDPPTAERANEGPPTPNPAAGASGERTLATIQGRILDAITKEPVPGATVWTSGSEPDPARGPVSVSDAAGGYRLVGVPYPVVKLRTGEELASFPLHVIADWMEPFAGGISREVRADGLYIIDLKLFPQPTMLTGVVRLNGAPVEGAEVWALGVDGLTSSGWSNSDGSYQTEVRAGPVVLFALRHREGLDHTPYGFAELEVVERARNECDIDLSIDEGTALTVTWHCSESTGPKSAGFHFALWLQGPDGKAVSVPSSWPMRLIGLARESEWAPGEPLRLDNLPRGTYVISFAKSFSDYCVLPAESTVLVVPGTPVEVSFVYGPSVGFGGQVIGLFAEDDVELRLVHRIFSGIATTAAISVDGSFGFPQVPRGLYRLSLVVDGRERGSIDVGPEANRELVLHAE